MDAELLEQGDIYFFYRPKKDAEEVKGIEDVRRFFMVTAPEQENNNNSKKNQLYRLFVIGKKSLPEVRKSEARASERQLFSGSLELRIGLCIKSWIRQIQKGFVGTSLYGSVIEESLKTEVNNGAEGIPIFFQ
jgi:hypothetical protein